MGIVVQKYGGTSVADVDRIRTVARRVLETVKAGHRVAVVVSAMAGETDQLVAWAREHRDPTRPGLWLHAPSVGEGLQARAVLEALHRRLPAVQTAYTHFSPSAEELAATIYHALDIPINDPQDASGISRTLTTGKPIMDLFG